jgi:polysaccharide biosynthesis/export protein
MFFEKFFRTHQLILVGVVLTSQCLCMQPSLAKTVDLTLKQFSERLAQGDKLRLTVVGFPELSGEMLVPLDGYLQIPMAGSISVLGLTPDQATQKITEALRPYVRHPKVGLALVGRRPTRVSITGEVRQPGPRFLNAPSTASDNSTGSGSEFQTLSTALLLAGGITPDADLRHILIRRKSADANANLDGQTAKTEVLVDLWKTIQTGDLSSDPQIFDGDEIVVPMAKLNASEQRVLLTSSVAPSKLVVQVAGQVQRPGSITVPPGSSITTAVAAAGGPNDKADSNQIALLRMTPEGKIDQRVFSFGQSAEPLRDGDVIVVAKSSTSSSLDFFGSLLTPLTPLFFLFR